MSKSSGEKQAAVNRAALRDGSDIPELPQSHTDEENWRFAIASHILSDQKISHEILGKIKSIFREAVIDETSLVDSLLNIRRQYTEQLLQYFISWGEKTTKEIEAAKGTAEGMSRTQKQLARYDEMSARSKRDVWDDKLTPSANVLFNGSVGGLDVMFDAILSVPLLLQSAQLPETKDSYESVLRNTSAYMYGRARVGSAVNEMVTTEPSFVVQGKAAPAHSALFNMNRYKLKAVDNGPLTLATNDQVTYSSGAIEMFYSGGTRYLDCPALHASMKGEGGEPLHANLIKALYEAVSEFGVKTIGPRIDAYLAEARLRIKK